MAESLPERRLRRCVENWPGAETGAYDPRCCRFPKSCSATVYDEAHVAERDLEPPVAEPEQSDVSVLDLVRQYASQRYMHGLDIGAGLAPDESRHGADAGALFARIAELLLQQPVQARDDRGWPLWQHDCQAITAFSAHVPENGAECSFCPRLDGPWRPLLVGGTPAPEPAAETYDEQTLVKVYDALKRAGLSQGQSINAVDEMQNLGLLFRERATCRPPAELTPELPHPSSNLAQVMEALGVDRPERVPDALNERLQLSERLGQMAALRERERDEARAEVERQAQQIARRLVDLERERDEARAEVERLNVAVSQEIEARDENAEWADRLANGIAEYLHVDIGEHSNMNLPWQAALIALPTPADPLVLSLPKVPKGTVALAGAAEPHRRYEPYVLPYEEDPVWRHVDDGALFHGLGGVLDAEHPHGVTIEMASPSEPAPRTAAEVWSALPGNVKQAMYSAGYAELAEALRRESEAL